MSDKVRKYREDFMIDNIKYETEARLALIVYDKIKGMLK